MLLPSRAVSAVPRYLFLKRFQILQLKILCVVLHGVGVNMLKVGTKRRRTKAEIAQEESNELAKQNEIRTKMARLDMIE